jgi:hypothetical protein
MANGSIIQPSTGGVPLAAPPPHPIPAVLTSHTGQMKNEPWSSKITLNVI